MKYLLIISLLSILTMAGHGRQYVCHDYRTANPDEPQTDKQCGKLFRDTNGFHFTAGDNSNYPGCGSCRCCKDAPVGCEKHEDLGKSILRQCKIYAKNGVEDLNRSSCDCVFEKVQKHPEMSKDCANDLKEFKSMCDKFTPTLVETGCEKHEDLGKSILRECKIYGKNSLKDLNRSSCDCVFEKVQKHTKMAKDCANDLKEFKAVCDKFNATPTTCVTVVGTSHLGDNHKGKYFNFNHKELYNVINTSYKRQNFNIYQRRNGQVIAKRKIVVWNAKGKGQSVGDNHGRYDDGKEKSGDWKTNDEFCLTAHVIEDTSSCDKHKDLGESIFRECKIYAKNGLKDLNRSSCDCVFEKVQKHPEMFNDCAKSIKAFHAVCAKFPASNIKWQKNRLAQCYVHAKTYSNDRLDNPVFNGGGFVGSLTLQDCKAKCLHSKDRRGRPCVAVEWSSTSSRLNPKQRAKCALLWGCDYTKPWKGGNAFKIIKRE